MIIRNVINLLLFSIPLALAICGDSPPNGATYIPIAVADNKGPLTINMDDAGDGPTAISISDISSDNCTQECLFSLSSYSPPHKHSSLFVRKELAEFVPWGYTKENSSIVHCARTLGMCGATVPVYRHFNWNLSGIFHTYTLEDTWVDGYTKEFSPLCYLWNVDAVPEEGSGENMGMTEGSGESFTQGSGEELQDLKRSLVARAEPAGGCNVQKPSRATMKGLVTWVNNLQGAQLDHFYSALPNDSAELVGYAKGDSLGLILTHDDINCDCLRTLVQTYDNQTGIFNRRDHKLMQEGAELNRIFEQYKLTGEKMWCAEEKNACGATIPIYKHFDFIHIDSLITTDPSNVPPYSYRYPTEPLCYIWTNDYKGITTVETATPEGSGTERTAEETAGTDEQTIDTETTQDRIKRSTTDEEELLTETTIDESPSSSDTVDPSTDSTTDRTEETEQTDGTDGSEGTDGETNTGSTDTETTDGVSTMESEGTETVGETGGTTGNETDTTDTETTDFLSTVDNGSDSPTTEEQSDSPSTSDNDSTSDSNSTITDDWTVKVTPSKGLTLRPTPTQSDDGSSALDEMILQFVKRLLGASGNNWRKIVKERLQELISRI